MLQILFAILAGILTIAAPCILPLLPILLGASLGQNNKSRPLFIVFGFILVFTVAAVALSILTAQLHFNSNIVRDIGVAALGLFGIFMLWPLPFERLMLVLSPAINRASAEAGLGDRGNFSAFVLGMTLGLVWTPCAGPVLGSILTLIALQQDLVTAFILLAAYAIGAGIPMLVIAYGGQYVSSRVEAIARYAVTLQKVFGVIILLLALAIYFNLDTRFYADVLKNYPVFNPKF